MTRKNSKDPEAGRNGLKDLGSLRNKINTVPQKTREGDLSENNSQEVLSGDEQDRLINFLESDFENNKKDNNSDELNIGDIVEGAVEKGLEQEDIFASEI
jgi:hypothetical protein